MLAALLLMGFAEGADSTEGRLVKAGDILAAVERGDSLEYDGAIVEGDLDLSGVGRLADVHFNDTVFEGSVNFEGVEFAGNAWFEKAKFSGGNADFSYVKFSGGDADFYFAEFSEGYADFTEAEFSGDAYFSETEFSGRCAFFPNAVFWGDVAFDYAEFSKQPSFINATFENVSFYGTKFGGNAYFDNAIVRGSLNLTRTEYPRLFLPWKLIDKEQLSCSNYDAYLAMVRNYANLGWYEDSNDCYFEYRNKCRAAEGILSAEGFLDSIEWIVYGYGVRPLRTLAWMLGLVLLFGLLFRNDGSIKKYIRVETERAVEESGDSVAVEIQTTLQRGELTLIDPFLFSLSTFTSGLTSFLYPQFEYRTEKHARLVILERLLGSVAIAIFITAISKTYLIR